eukprot:7377852-Prymnesium_polylepis.1
MRDFGPARASAELRPGTAAAPRALPVTMMRPRSRPAARTPRSAQLLRILRALESGSQKVQRECEKL